MQEDLDIHINGIICHHADQAWHGCAHRSIPSGAGQPQILWSIYTAITVGCEGLWGSLEVSMRCLLSYIAPAVAMSYKVLIIDLTYGFYSGGY